MLGKKHNVFTKKDKRVIICLNDEFLGGKENLCLKDQQKSQVY